jgi:hypothetical protein
MTEELFELMLEFGVEMNLLAERFPQLADELMGRVEVIGEWVGRCDYNLLYVKSCSIDGTKSSKSQTVMAGRE